MKQTTIAIADDNSDDANRIKKELESCGNFKVVFHSFNGAEFLRNLKINGPVDIAIIDLHMPILCGHDTIKMLLLAEAFKGKVLAITYGYYSSIIEQLKQIGTHGFCCKMPDKVVYAVRKLVNEETFYDESYNNLWRHESNSKSLHKLDDDSQVSSLSSLEKRILKNLAKGYTSKEMAPHIGLEYNTIEHYKSNLIKRLNLKNDKHLLSWGYAVGLLDSKNFYDTFKHESSAENIRLKNG